MDYAKRRPDKKANADNPNTNASNGPKPPPNGVATTSEAAEEFCELAAALEA